MSAPTKPLAPAPPVDDISQVILPRNLEAETSTLGAALVDEKASDYIADNLTAEDYFRRSHQTIFEVIASLRARNVVADLLTVKDALGPKRLEEIGGPVALSGLCEGVPRAVNVPYYAALLKDARLKRDLLRHAHQTVNHVAAGENTGRELVDDADRRLLSLQIGHGESRMKSLRDSQTDLLRSLEWRYEHRGELTGIPTGFTSIDALTLGWQRGDLIVVAARPSIGKTTFVLNTARAAAEGGYKVAIFSLEMRREPLEYRLLSSASQIGLSVLKSGHLGSKEMERISHSLEYLANLEIHIDDRSGQSAMNIRSTCRRLKAERGLDLIVIDYCQLMPGTVKGNRNEQITDISRRMKELAGDSEAAVMLLSQLSRLSEKEDRPPKISDLRESGALEQDADIVGLLHRKHHRESGRTQFIIAKQRDGETGTINLNIDRPTVTFTDAGVEPEPVEAPPEPSTPSLWRGKPGGWRRS